MKIAKTRDWTAAEVLAAKEYIQEMRPGLWEKLLGVEATTRDFRELDIAHIAKGLLHLLHPECDGVQIPQLFGALRDEMNKKIHRNK